VESQRAVNQLDLLGDCSSDSLAANRAVGAYDSRLGPQRSKTKKSPALRPSSLLRNYPALALGFEKEDGFRSLRLNSIASIARVKNSCLSFTEGTSIPKGALTSWSAASTNFDKRLMIDFLVKRRPARKENHRRLDPGVCLCPYTLHRYIFLRGVDFLEHRTHGAVGRGNDPSREPEPLLDSVLERRSPPIRFETFLTGSSRCYGKRSVKILCSLGFWSTPRGARQIFPGSSDLSRPYPGTKGDCHRELGRLGNLHRLSDGSSGIQGNVGVLYAAILSHT